MAIKDNTEAIKKEIWKIRNLNDDFEKIKDRIIAFYNNQQNLNESTKKLWISDIKECYYSIIAAWELIWGYNPTEKEFLENSKNYLYRAKSLCSQSVSELKSFNIDEVSTLISHLNMSFERCFNALKRVLDKLMPPRILNPPTKKVIKISDLEYQFPCSVCGKIAVNFKIDLDPFKKEECIIYTGITHQTYMKIDLTNELFNLLEKENITLIHEFIKKYHTYEGLDAYCPKCDKVYCWDHYNPIEEFDDGFYDCTYGTCPKGHRRMIDD